MVTSWKRFVIVFTLWMITVTQQAESKVVTINNHGNNSTACCVDGSCPCSSLSFALEKINNNTIINITSESVVLNTTTPIGSGNLHNITITSNGTTIMCNNSGGVRCESCSDVIIEGITWDQCGDPTNKDTMAGVYLTVAHNIKIERCIFRRSQVCALSILNQASSNITVRNTKFIHNVITRPVSNACNYECGGLNITVNNRNESITILDSIFMGNRHVNSNCSLNGLAITTSNPKSHLSLSISRSEFESNSGGLFLFAPAASVAPIVLSELVFNSNTNQGIWFPLLDVTNSDILLTISNSSFTNNGNGGIVCEVLSENSGDENVNIVVEHSNFTNNSVSTASSSAVYIRLNAWTDNNNNYNVSIQYCNFINNNNQTVLILSTESRILSTLVSINEVLVKGSQMTGYPSGGGVVSVILNGVINNTIIINNVIFSSNKYMEADGGALYIEAGDAINQVYIINCLFQENTAYGEGAALFLVDGNTENSELADRSYMTIQSNFTNNSGGNSVVYISAASTFTMVHLIGKSVFHNNIGTAIHLLSSTLSFGQSGGDVIFSNNSANRGGAIYCEHGVTLFFYNESRINFTDNSAAQYGGAIYADLGSNCGASLFSYDSPNSNWPIQFSKNSAGVSGNSVYFNVHRHCKINSDYNSTNSILYFLYHLQYHEPRSKTIVSSPQSLLLYFDGVQTGDNTYLAKHNILGHRISFNGSVFDYFNHSAAPTQFDVHCHDNCAGIELTDNRILVDNVTTRSLILTGEQVTSKGRNVTLKVASVLETIFNKIISSLIVVELVPCSPGYTYNRFCNCCDCYHHQDIVECVDDYNEIKRGYWFGTVRNTTTVSLCPKQYCEYGKHRKETRLGYCIIPQELDDQCKLHRTGIACGDCSSGYTLTYDSPDCVSHHQCSPLMTTLVIVLTILYWIAIIGVVFGVMNFRCRISSGYVYGILYYYSIVDILLDNNPYITGGVFQLVSLLSSFAKLSPQLFGKLCFVEGLSRIDQQFIHYSHAIAISLFLVIIIIIARHRPKVAYYVSHCIIHVICLLLLLAYTSLASTSLQLLKPLIFAGVDEVYVYLSPSYKYFRGRHAFYGIVATLCGLIVVIGMPLILLIQPFINPMVSFIKIMPIVDQFQSCYKDKYRYFASYYLICRLLIILIVFICDSNYYTMLYCLQTTCVVIAMIHIWIQPYKDSFLNGLDGVILLTIALVVNINSFTFLSTATPGIISVLVVLPLLIFCMAGIKKLVSYCMSRRRKLEDDFGWLDSYNDERVSRNKSEKMRYEGIIGNNSGSTNGDDDDGDDYMLDP